MAGRLSRTITKGQPWRPQLSLRILVLATLLVSTERLPAEDCNDNELDDLSDIADGRSADCNDNGVADECEGFPVQLGFRDDGFPLDDAPLQVVVVDVNVDGIPDIVAASRGATESTIYVALGNNDGTLSPPFLQAAGARLQAFAAEDLDGDGDPDLAAANSDSLWVLRNDGTGHFDRERLPASPDDARSVAIADVSTDGWPDLVVPEARGDRVTIHQGTPDGSFTELMSLAVETFPVSVATTDVDGDGNVDIAVANRSSNSVSVLRNLGGNRFAAAENYSVPQRPDRLSAVDLDHDGAPDLVVDGIRTLTLLINTGDGKFAELAVFPERAISFVIEDIDGDGDFDIAATTSATNPITVLVQQSPRRFVKTTELDLRWVPGALGAGDMDGDGDIDLVVGNTSTRTLLVLWNNEPGTLAFGSTTVSPSGRPHSIGLGDLNNDGLPDVVTSNGGDRTVSILLSGERGTLKLARSWLVEGSGHLNWITSDDFDLDGHPDFVIADLAGKLQLLWGVGDGTLLDAVVHPLEVRPERVTSGDLNGDGLVDVVTTNRDASSISVILNEGGRNFSTPRNILARAAPVAAAVTDLDLDGTADVAVANRNAGSVSLFLNLGGGDLVLTKDLPIDGLPTYLVAADLNGDGKPDLVTANEVTSHLVVLLHQGGTEFASPVTYGTRSEPFSVVAADLDGGGVIDLVTANERSGTLSVLQGWGDGTFRPASLHDVGGGVRFLVAGDLDRDGDTDLVTGNRGNGTITLLLNESGTTSFDEDFLESICTEFDFHKMAAFSAGARSCEFLVPAKAGDDRPTLFQNTRRFPRQDAFLTATFPELYGTLTPERYARLVSRRATREYFSGSLRQIRADSLVYGFTIDVGEADDEQLGVEEVRFAFEQLKRSMLLRPLVYAPDTPRAANAASSWQDPGFRIVPTAPPIVEPEPEPPTDRPTFTLEIPPDITLCGTFFESGATRGVEDEYELKTTLRLRDGMLELPTEANTFEAELFEEVRFGVERTVLNPLSAGTFEVVQLTGADGVGAYRFTFSQSYEGDDGLPLEVELVTPLTLRARGDQPLERTATLHDNTWVALKGREPFQASRGGVPLARYGSCTYESLPLWKTRAHLADGVTLLLEERFAPAERFFDTGPASLTFAELRFDDQRHTVNDYFQLIYSAARHNTDVKYAVFLGDPIELPFLPTPARAIELHAPTPERPEARAFYRGPDQEIVAEVAVVDYVRERVESVPFRRADTNQDGAVNVVDVVLLLNTLFAHSAVLLCAKTADVNDDGSVNITDAIVTVGALFGRQDALPTPFQKCGDDPTPDRLRCEIFQGCE
jgi:hypothetical protein